MQSAIESEQYLGWFQYESTDKYLKKKVKPKIISGRGRGIDFVSCILFSSVNSGGQLPSILRSDSNSGFSFTECKIISVSMCVCVFWKTGYCGYLFG